MAKDSKKPKVETRRGLSPVGMASFPNLFVAKKINANDAGEEPKFRLTHVYKVAEFSDTNRKAFNEMVGNVNEVCRLELLKTFTNFSTPDGTQEFTAEGMVAAFEAKLEEFADKPLKAHYAAFAELKWWDKKDQILRSCRSPFLLGKNDEYVDDDAVYVRMSSKADRPPQVVNQSKDPCDEKDIYGGAEVRASYIAYPYNNLGNRGVTLYMGNVQLCSAGVRLGGGPSAADEFDEVPVESPAADVAF